MITINSADCLVLEYCSGGTIEDLVESHGPIRPPKLYRYCCQIRSAVEYIHQNKIAYQDIKPSSIMLDSRGKIKLTDFGLSVQNASGKTKFSGTKRYMAPEILNRMKGCDTFLAGIYSLGNTFYFMLQGHDLFVANDHKELIHLICGNIFPPPQNVDPMFGNLICHIMSYEPKNRTNLSFLISNTIFQKHHSTSKCKISSNISGKNSNQKKNSKSIIYQ
jgi:serine/threonine protein kinase